MRSGSSTTIAFLYQLVVLMFIISLFTAVTASVRAQSTAGKPNRLLEKSLALMDKAKFKQANVHLKKAAKLFLKAEKPVMAAHCYNHLSSNSQFINNLADSRRQAKKALSLLEGMQLNDPTERIRAYTNLGLRAAVQARYEKSMDLLKKASALLDDPAVSPVLKMVVISSLGYLYDDLGKYDKALYYYDDALEILLAQPDPPKDRLAKIYNNIGVAYSNKGLYKRARHYYRLELKINLAIKGVNHPHVAGTYLNIGNSYYRAGDVGEALIYFERAFRSIQNAYGRYHSMTVLALNNLAKCEIKLGNNQKAIGYLKDAIEIKKQLVGAGHPELAISYQTLAGAYAEAGHNQKAQKYYLEALEVRKKNLPKNHPDIAPTYNALAVFLLDNGQAEKALTYLAKARNILLASVGSHHPSLAETHAAMGWAYAQQGKVVQSISYFQNALTVTAPPFNGVKAKKNPKPAAVAYPAKAISVLKVKAKGLWLLHKKTNNPSLLKASLYTYYALSKLLDKQQWAYNQLTSKLAIARQSYRTYERAINAAYKMYEITGNRSYFHLIFYFSEKSKGRVLLEAVAHTNDKQLAGIPREVLKRGQQLKHALAQVKQALYNAESSPAAEKYSPARLKDSLFVLNRKIAAFTKNLEQKYPRYYRLKYNSSFPEIYVIQKGLEATNAAIVEYFYGEQSLYVIVITPEKVRVEPLNASPALSAQVAEFRSAIVSGSDAYFKLAYQLYLNLIAPIRPFIKSYSALRIVPGGPLRLLPFGALLKNKIRPTGKVSFNQLPYLISDYNISYSTSLSLNAAMASTANEYKQQFIGFAPIFKPETTRGIKNVVNTTSIKWKPLSFTDYEVKTIASKFKKEGRFWSFLPWNDEKSISLFIGPEATESNFKSSGSLNGRYIHLATHAFASRQMNGRTGIVFYQNGNTKNDDILYTSEIYNLRLRTELVVLSACETGLGRIIPGEGLMGLSRAFQYAGANNLIVSLWKAGDRSTAKLMISFYDNLRKKYSMAKALSMAKRAMIEDRRFAHPRYWATFKLIGNG